MNASLRRPGLAVVLASHHSRLALARTLPPQETCRVAETELHPAGSSVRWQLSASKSCGHFHRLTLLVPTRTVKATLHLGTDSKCLLSFHSHIWRGVLFMRFAFN